MKLGELIKMLKESESHYGKDIEVEIGKERSGILDTDKIGGICGLGTSGKETILIYDIYSDM